jgi:hypothetical protein
MCENGYYCCDQCFTRAERRAHSSSNNERFQGQDLMTSEAIAPSDGCVQDLLHIGNQSRPHMFDLAIRRPDVLYSKVVEISERVILETCAESGRQPLAMTSPPPIRSSVGVTGETVQIIEDLGISYVA